MIYCLFSEVEKYLLFTSEHAIRGDPNFMTSQYAHKMPYSDAIVPIIGINTKFIGVDYDIEDNYIYFSEVLKDIIYRARPDGTGQLTHHYHYNNIYT